MSVCVMIRLVSLPLSPDFTLNVAELISLGQRNVVPQKSDRVYLLLRGDVGSVNN